jgi:Carboxypeptidase regulatory-like domain/TonB-dependent Receptor Plug Domain/TonB dependent receptor
MRAQPEVSRLVFRQLTTRLTMTLAWVAAFLLLFSGSMKAQIDTGRLTGTVKDSLGAVIVRAHITLTNHDTGVAAVVETTPTGTYVFEAISPGTYTLQATSSGFKTYSSDGVIIHLQQNATIDIRLLPGSATEDVLVSAAAPLLQAADASLGQTIDEKTIDNMPLNGRNWTSLGQLAAGVTTSSAGNTSSGFFSVSGINYHQNDYRLNGIDNNLELYQGGSSTNASINPPPDALEEFKLQNADYSAEFGHSTAGILNAVIKSGGNQVHGNLWEYVRNDAIDANDYFSNQNHVPIPEYRLNQFGGTIGGPVYLPKLYNGKDKTFFFFDYQGTRIVQPSNVTSTVPTTLMASSGFTNLEDLITYNAGTRQDALKRTFPLGTVFDPATTRTVAAGALDPYSGLVNGTGAAIQVRDPFYTGGSIVGITNFTGLATRLNQLPAARLDPNAVKLLSIYPAQTSPGFANNYYHVARTTQNTNQLDLRIDQNFSTKDIVFGVFSWSHVVTYQPGGLPGIADGQSSSNGTKDSPHYAIALGHTHLFTSSLTNEFHVGYDHNIDNNLPLYGNVFGIPDQFGIQGIPQVPGNGGLSAIDITGLSNLGTASYIPTIRTIAYLELTDNVTKIYRSHVFKTGYLIDSIRANIVQPPYGKGTFTYNGQYSSIPNANASLTGISDLLLVPTNSTVNGTNFVGGVSTFGGSNYSPTDDHRYYMGAYIQDDWKATPRLTLNLGVRWDLTTPYLEVNGRQANFIAANGNGPTGTYFLPEKTCNDPRSASFNSLAAKDQIAITCLPGKALGTSPYSNFAPRFGIAYRITPSFVARAGYGIAYGTLDSIGFGGTLGQNYPFLYTVSRTSSNTVSPLSLPNGATATMENSLAEVSLTDASLLNPATGISLSGRQYRMQTPYEQTMNFTLQYQIGKTNSVQAGYVGTFGRHLDTPSTSNSASAILPPGASLTSNIAFPDFSPNSELETTNAASNYNSLQTVYTRQLTHGLSVLANYTYSRCLTNQIVFGGTLPLYRAEYLPGFGIGQDYQLCQTDSTHVFHISGIYEVPLGHGRQFLGGANRWVDTAIGGWAFNYIFTHQSGQPFTLTCPVSTTAFFGCNANVLPGANIYAGPHDQQQWLNPAAFTNPPIASATQTNFAVLGGRGMQARGPGLTNLDASLFKEFSIHEQVRLQFRAEAFNLSNTAQFKNPSSQLNFTNTTKFSQITALVGNPRLLQFALKLYF